MLPSHSRGEVSAFFLTRLSAKHLVPGWTYVQCIYRFLALGRFLSSLCTFIFDATYLQHIGFQPNLLLLSSTDGRSKGLVAPEQVVLLPVVHTMHSYEALVLYGLMQTEFPWNACTHMPRITAHIAPFKEKKGMVHASASALANILVCNTIQI